MTICNSDAPTQSHTYEMLRRIQMYIDDMKLFTKNEKELETQIAYLPNPSVRAGYDTRSIFKQSLTGLKSEFSFS